MESKRSLSYHTPSNFPSEPVKTSILGQKANQKAQYYTTFTLVMSTPLIISHGDGDGFIMETKLEVQS